MTIDNNAVQIPGEGHFYLGDVGATKPVGTNVPPVLDFPEIGHTSYDSPLTIAREGGKSTVLRSWQAQSLRTRVEPVVYKFDFGLLQRDETSLTLYYGGGVSNVTTDEFEVPKTPVPQEHALFVRVVDGTSVEAFYLGRVEIIGSDSVELDPENLTGMAVEATVLDDAALSYLFSIANPSTVLP